MDQEARRKLIDSNWALRRWLKMPDAAPTEEKMTTLTSKPSRSRVVDPRARLNYFGQHVSGFEANDFECGWDYCQKMIEWDNNH